MRVIPSETENSGKKRERDRARKIVRMEEREWKELETKERKG